MLQCLLTSEIPLLISFDVDVLKRRFSMFPKAFGHVKITFGKILLFTFTIHNIVYFELCLFKGGCSLCFFSGFSCGFA